MDGSMKTGFSFGLTSATITTLGLMVGLDSSTHSKIAVLGGIVTIAIADALSDALGIHVSEEAENHHTSREIWESTLSTFAAKFIFALTFIVPLLLLPLGKAIIADVAWGMLILGIASYFVARECNKKPAGVIIEHLTIAITVIFLTHYVGDWVGTVFV